MFEETYDKDYLEFQDPFKCIGDIGGKWCNFKWQIYDLQLNPNDIIQSPVFTTRLLPNTHWYVEIKLSSPGDLRTMHVSLNRLQNHGKIALIVDVIYKVFFPGEIMISEKQIIEYNNAETLDEKMTFSAPFRKSNNNSLTVYWKLRPNRKMIRDVHHLNVDRKLSIHFRWLLLTGELFDTIIRVGDYRLIAHIAILSARLPNLLEKCLAPSKEDGKHIININDLPVSVVKEMLKYAYTGQAYVDLESESISKDLLISYSQKFWKSCCWEDHPFAKTFFNYETDTLSWHLEDIFVKSNLGSQHIDLLKFFPSKITFSLDIDESEKADKWLMLTFEFLSEEIPKPTIVSCSTFLVNRESNETLELGVTEALLRSNKTKGELKLCSLLKVLKGKETFRTTYDSLILQTDFKFCYGSYKSTIENIYEGQFDISECRSCLQLSADMEALYNSQNYWDITVENEHGHKCFAHKAILLTRWPEAGKHEMIKNNHVIMVETKLETLNNFLLQLYKGTPRT